MLYTMASSSPVEKVRDCLLYLAARPPVHVQTDTDGGGGENDYLHIWTYMGRIARPVPFGTRGRMQINKQANKHANKQENKHKQTRTERSEPCQLAQHQGQDDDAAQLAQRGEEGNACGRRRWGVRGERWYEMG